MSLRVSDQFPRPPAEKPTRVAGCCDVTIGLPDDVVSMISTEIRYLLDANSTSKRGKLAKIGNYSFP